MILLNKTKFEKKRFVLLKNRKDILRNKKIAKKVEDYYNYLLDKIVLEDLEVYEDDLYLTLDHINSVPITEDFRQLIYDNDLFYQDIIELNEEKNKAIEDITSKQVSVFVNNFNYVNNLLDTHDLNKQEYQDKLKESPNIDRRELLDLSVGGINSSLLKNSVTLKGSVKAMSENQYRENQMQTSFESAVLNKNIVSKIWSSSGLDNSRHDGMDGKICTLYEQFEVMNDYTGEVDYMLYPHDSSGSPGNICNCQCDVIYSDEPP